MQKEKKKLSEKYHGEVDHIYMMMVQGPEREISYGKFFENPVSP